MPQENPLCTCILQAECSLGSWSQKENSRIREGATKVSKIIKGIE